MLGLLFAVGLMSALIIKVWPVSEYAECRSMCEDNGVKLFRGKMDREYSEASPPECECFPPGTASAGDGKQDAGVAVSSSAGQP